MSGEQGTVATNVGKVDALRRYFEEHIEGPVHWNGDEGTARYPRHDDQNPSLSILCIEMPSPGSARGYGRVSQNPISAPQ